VERHLIVSLSDSSGVERFAKLALNSPPLANFADTSVLIEHLRVQRDGPIQPPSASEVLCALIQCGSKIEDRELSQSVLILAFMPTIHRTYREVRAWYREIPTDDIAQQIFVCFLELAASAPVGLLESHLSFALARSLRRNAVRWARKETLILLEREKQQQERKSVREPTSEGNFEPVSLLNDFLDYCCRIGILSPFERDLLIKLKVEGFLAKEASDTNTVLSGKAVQRRIERIMDRLKRAASETTAGQSCKVLRGEDLSTAKNISRKAGHFSLGHSADFLALGKSRRQFSLDISPGQTTTKVRQFSMRNQDSPSRFVILPLEKWQQCVIQGVTSRRLAAIKSPDSHFPLRRHTKSGESLPSNPDARPARIIQKELARNEKVFPKQIRLPLARRGGLAPARVRHILLLADSRISGIC
ncbi:MAG: hypothetical protein ACREDR_39630, partial [Blastocatellia bacterium]